VVGGEGASSIVLETIEHANARGAQPLAYVLATASRFCPSDAMKQHERSAAIDPPRSRAVSSAIAAAIDAVLESSEISAEQIGLVVSHAMGDPASDSGEADAVDRAGVRAPWLSIAASIGHTGAASGMMGLAAGVLALCNQTIPPTRHENVNPKVSFCDRPTPLQSPYVLCLSYTTDGSALAVLLSDRPR
jgi:3-oxoacyl-(acyl-carrier-protein) synthase